MSQAQIKKEYSAAKAGVWGGAILAGIGVPLTFYGSTHHQECVDGGYVLGSGLECFRYSSSADWKIMGPGLGAMGAGIFAVIHSTQTMHRKRERLKELDRIRQQNGWTVTVKSTGLMLAYRW